MVLALALHLDPVYVGAHHLARFLVVTFSLAIAARRLRRKRPRRAIAPGWSKQDRGMIRIFQSRIA